jgi:hypothetical protein
MPAEPFKRKPGTVTDNGVWEKTISVIATRVNRECFETWFLPLRFIGLDGKICSLVVPNEYFRKSFVENYKDLLEEALNEAVGEELHLQITVQDQSPSPDEPSLLPVVAASALESPQQQAPWLIERLWSAGAVGIVSGPPKALKTWTALEMAIAVSTGVPCLSTFPVHRTGPVLLYAAEEPMPALHTRLHALAHAHQLELDQVDIRVIAADALRLDRLADRERLTATVEFHYPVLLILDPLIRLHGLDENQSGPMAELLGYFRTLQRKTGTAIIIVHHSRKGATSSSAPGQSLRGSSDLYAFVDSLVTLDRRRDRVTLSAEHRSAPGIGPLPLELVLPTTPEESLSLRLDDSGEDDGEIKQIGLAERIHQHLSALAGEPATTEALRSLLRVRKQRLVEALHELIARGQIVRLETGYRLASNNHH